MGSDRILVVDDHAEMMSLLQDALGDAGYQVDVAKGGEAAIQRLQARPFDLVLTDLRMEHTDGFDVLAAAHRLNPELPVLIMTAFGAVESAVEAMRRGAAFYFTKPFQLTEVLLLVQRVLEEQRLKVENRHLRRLASQQSSLGELIGESEVMRHLFQLVERVASSPAPALLRGESGTGKDIPVLTQTASVNQLNEFNQAPVLLLSFFYTGLLLNHPANRLPNNLGNAGTLCLR